MLILPDNRLVRPFNKVILPIKGASPLSSILLLGHKTGPPPPPVYATWNPSDADTNITILDSPTNLVAGKNNVAGVYSIRATQGKSSGKWYWEIGADSGVNNANIYIGAVESTFGLSGTSFGGFRAYWAGTGNKYSPNTAFGASYDLNPNTIGVKLDMDAGTIEVLKANVSQGTLVTGLSGTLYPFIGIGLNSGKARANFGASAFVYSVPSGYNSGVYT